MDFRNTNTRTYNLEDERTEFRAYAILDKVPPSLYKEVLQWTKNELDFNKMTLSISDCKSDINSFK